MYRTRFLLLALALAGVMLPAHASAATIGLNQALSGSFAGGNRLALTVTFDPNGVGASNLVSHELYVATTGLAPLAASHAPGSLYAPFPADVLDLSGACANTQACSAPPVPDPASPQHFASFVVTFAPALPSGPGGLFTLLLDAVPGATDWTLDLVGDDAFALLWEVPCGNDPQCIPGSLIEPVPFVVVEPGDVVAAGTARVNVSVVQTVRPVPEPAAGLLLVLGALFVWRARGGTLALGR